MVQGDPPSTTRQDSHQAGEMTRRQFVGAGGAVAADTFALSAPGQALGQKEDQEPTRAAAPKPKTMLVKNATILVTMDANRREIKDGGLFIKDGRIVQDGPTAELPKEAEELLDLKGPSRVARADPHPSLPVPDPLPRGTGRGGRQRLPAAGFCAPVKADYTIIDGGSSSRRGNHHAGSAAGD